jgi:hypothetical protein
VSAMSNTPLPTLVRDYGDDGYGRMERNIAAGWDAISGWGEDGWDLGSWPYVIVYHGTVNGRFGAATDVEGDIDVSWFASRSERDAHTDALAFWYWKQRQEPWVADYMRLDSVDDLPSRLRGPYSRSRMESGQ